MERVSVDDHDFEGITHEELLRFRGGADQIHAKASYEPIVPEGLQLSPDLDPRDKGACKGLDADMFHPKGAKGIAAAKKICAMCSVEVKCLEYALENDERKGVWGGKSERERARIAKDRGQSKIAQG